MSKLIIFDLDGTVIDSIPDIQDNLNKTLVHFGFSEVSYARCKEIIGHGARNLVKGALPSGTADSLIDEALAYYNKLYTESGSPKTRIYGGMKDTLSKLRSAGYSLAILTNKPQMTADALAEGILKGLFDLIVGGREGRALKPDREAVLPVLEHFGAKAEETYMVGDMTADILTAKNSGMIPVSVLWGYGKESDLSALGVKLFAEKPEKLLAIIE